MLPGRGDYDLRPRALRADLVAGVTVGVVALPLALAFGASAGVGPAAGIVTAVVAGVVAAVFGGSRLQVSGPTGAMAVVLAPIVAAHGVGAVAAVSILAGVLVVAAGLLRLGRLVSFLPWPVIEGFTVGIACVIGLQQVPAALAAPADGGHGVLAAAAGAVRAAGTVVPTGTLLWATGTVAAVVVVMVVLQRVHAGIPASLVAVVLVTVVAEAAGAPLPRIGALPDTLPVPTVPGLDVATLPTLGGAALAVAALAAIESLLSARVAATMAPSRGAYDPNRELVGQGLASVASGLFGGMPATGAIARTAVNVRSGARTRLAAVLHALVILAVVLLAAGTVSRIPLAALAGVLLVTCVRMVSRATVRSVFGAGRSAAAAFVVTAVLTVALDLIVAIEVGLAVAVLLALRHLAGTAHVRVEPLPGEAEPGDERITLLRLEGPLFFGAADRVSREVLRRSGDDSGVVILRLSGLAMVDASGAVALSELIADLEAAGTIVLVKGVQDRHREVLESVRTLDGVTSRGRVFDGLEHAVGHARSHVGTQATGTVVRRAATGD